MLMLVLKEFFVVGNFFSVKLHEPGILSFGYYVRAKFSICFWKGSICKVVQKKEVKLEIGFNQKKKKGYKTRNNGVAILT